ncbi:PDR/VanB family oxidoreductase [Nocardia australiensis]|uniref:PDR/VanB family oxidoreductase n=1 Tax=Nocardia australiensis TaxID=2887191 RepID=UPI001D1574FF|nr:PDR/VanB family oxidoreductase [Nocardia australiensis]
MRNPSELNESMVIVHRRTVLTDEIVELELRRADGVDLPCWDPGSHIEVVLSEDMIRQYSLCGDPDDRSCWKIAVLREDDGRGGSRRIHEEWHEGIHVVVRGPRNLFPFQPAPNYVFIAGGIGITPMLPMISAAVKSGSQWSLHYGGRSLSSMAFTDRVLDIGSADAWLYPQDEVGLIDLDSALAAPESETLVYCCGPEPLLTAVEDRCRSYWPSDALHVERFAPKDTVESANDEAFEVELIQSGVTVTVNPGESVLSAVEAVGVPVLASCLEGTCATCEVTVVEGVPDHRDSVLSEREREANNTMMICVSRSVSSRLVLDL